MRFSNMKNSTNMNIPEEVINKLSQDMALELKRFYPFLNYA